LICAITGAKISKANLHVIPLQRDDHRGGALNGTTCASIPDIDLKKFGSEVLRAADIDRTDIEFTWTGLGERDEFSDRTNLRIRVDHHHEIEKPDGRDRSKVVYRS